MAITQTLYCSYPHGCETAADRVKRLERERDELDKQLADAREAAKPKKTRGEEIVDLLIDEKYIEFNAACDWVFPNPDNRLSRIINAEIARAKAEQREADAKIVDEFRCYNIGGDIAHAIRNQK